MKRAQHQLPRLKRLLLPAVLALFAAGTTAVNANVLFNANLDQIGYVDLNINQTPIGWTVAATKSISGTYWDGGDSETWCNVLDAGGYGFFFKPFSGSLGPPADLLTVSLYQDNPATPGTKFTLSGYAAGEANYSGFFATNSPAPQTVLFVEFLDGTGNSLATNTYDLIAASLPSTGPGSMALFTTAQYTAPAGTAKVRAGAMIANTYSTTGAQSFFVDAFDLESVAPPGSPVITNQPAQTTVRAGTNATFTVGVQNPIGASYQWQFNNAVLTDGPNISGSTTASLTISSVNATNIGHYRVLVSNSSGSVYSTDATLAIFNLNFFPVTTIQGKIGDTYRIDYSTHVAPSNWIPLSTNKLTASPQMFIDSTSPGDNTRFYRAVFLY